MIADAGADRPPVVLLCGGLGLRQRADGDDMPKPLRPLPDGRALLLHVLDYYRRFDLHEFVLCVGYGADRIRALLAAYFSTPEGDLVTGPGWQRFTADGLQVTLVDGGPYAEKSDRLLASLPHIGPRPFLLGYGDVLSDLDLDLLLRTHRAAGGVLTLVATRVRSPYGELHIDGGTAVTSFVEKPMRSSLISAGYFMCEPSLFAMLSPGEPLEDSVLPRLVARGRVHAVVHDGLWLPFDTYKDFIDASLMIEENGFPWLTPA